MNLIHFRNIVALLILLTMVACKSISQTQASRVALSEPLTLVIVGGHTRCVILDVDTSALTNVYLSLGDITSDTLADNSFEDVKLINTFRLNASDIEETRKWIDDKTNNKHSIVRTIKDGYEFYVFIDGELISHETEINSETLRNIIKPHEPTERLVEILAKYIGDYHLWEW